MHTWFKSFLLITEVILASSKIAELNCYITVGVLSDGQEMEINYTAGELWGLIQIAVLFIAHAMS
jgi:hypothetical protein